MAAVVGTTGHFGVDASSTTSTEEYEYTNLSMKIDDQRVEAAGTRGTRSHQSERVKQGTNAPGFSITLNPNSVELDAWLPRILGAAEVADAFALAETLPTFVANIDAVSKRFHFSGCKVGRASFRASQGQLLEMNMDAEALTIAESATSFPALTISAVAPYIMSELVVSVAGTGYQFRDFDLSIDNGLLTDRFFMGTTRVSLPEADRTITWTLNGPYGDNVALWSLAVAGVACVATFTLGNRSLVFSSTGVCFPRQQPGPLGREEIMLPMTGIARKVTTTMELTCTNDSAG